MQEAVGNRKLLSKAAHAGLLLALAAAVLVMVSGIGSRLQWWHFGTGFSLLRWGVYLGIAAVILAILGLAAGGKRVLLSAMLTLGIVSPLILVPAAWLYSARSVPPIHDITTDTENPPRFEAVVALRQDAPNSLEYGGEALAAQQRAAYPHIQPVVSGASPQAAFEAALLSAQELGWEIVAQDFPGGRIEAVDTTFWFGFKDDVVIRITPRDSGSRVDLRSVSRVGRSDVGTNAARIAAFIDAFRNRVQ